MRPHCSRFFQVSRDGIVIPIRDPTLKSEQLTTPLFKADAVGPYLLRVFPE